MEKKKDGFVFWIAIVVFLAVIALFASSCHTVHGVGQDLQDMTRDYVE